MQACSAAPRVLAICQRTRQVGLAVVAANRVIEVRRVNRARSSRAFELRRIAMLALDLAGDYGAEYIVLEPNGRLCAIRKYFSIPIVYLGARDAAAELLGCGENTVANLAQHLIAEDPRLARLVTVLRSEPLEIARTERWRTMLLYAVALGRAAAVRLTN